MDITMVMAGMPALQPDTGPPQATAEGEGTGFGDLLAEQMQDSGETGATQNGSTEGTAQVEAEAPRDEKPPVDEGQDLAQQLAGLMVQQLVAPPADDTPVLKLDVAPATEVEMAVDTEAMAPESNPQPEQQAALPEQIQTEQPAPVAPEVTEQPAWHGSSGIEAEGDIPEEFHVRIPESTAVRFAHEPVVPKAESEAQPVQVPRAEGPAPQTTAQAETQPTGKLAPTVPIAQVEARPQQAEETAPTLAAESTAAAYTPKQVEAAPLFEPQPLDTQQPEFPNAFAEVVQQKVDMGAKHFDIALYPKELGKVTVSVELQEGQAVLSFICENAKSQSILNAHAGAIGSLIEQNTGRQTVVETPQTAQQEAGQENYDGHNGEGRQQSRNEDHRPQREQVGFFIDQLKSTMLVG